MNDEQINDGLKYRLVILYTWTICYLVILISHCLIQSKTIELTEALGYFAITNAILLPQLTVILTFFYKKKESEIRSIIQNAPFAKFAFYTSLLFIITYTALTIIAYPLPKLTNHAINVFANPDWDYPKASVNIAKIMGNVMFFSTGAITYLFGKNESKPLRKMQVRS